MFPAPPESRETFTTTVSIPPFTLTRPVNYQIYHKSKLVVGVEKMPFMKYLGFINDIVINIGGTTGSLGRQKESSNFVADDGTKVAPVICYESVFGEYVASYVKKGAQLIFIITNDGWWKNTPGYKQHMSFARLRAIETRRSIARAQTPEFHVLSISGVMFFSQQVGGLTLPLSSRLMQTMNYFLCKFGDLLRVYHCL